jgi:hypothetical protein
LRTSSKMVKSFSDCLTIHFLSYGASADDLCYLSPWSVKSTISNVKLVVFNSFDFLFYYLDNPSLSDLSSPLRSKESLSLSFYG